MVVNTWQVLAEVLHTRTLKLPSPQFYELSTITFLDRKNYASGGVQKLSPRDPGKEWRSWDFTPNRLAPALPALLSVGKLSKNIVWTVSYR